MCAQLALIPIGKDGKRFARKSDSNSVRIRDSFRPDRKSAINFLPVSWIKIIAKFMRELRYLSFERCLKVFKMFCKFLFTMRIFYLLSSPLV